MSTPGLLVVCGAPAVSGRASLKGRCQGSAGGRPRQRPEVLDTYPSRRRLVAAEYPQVTARNYEVVAAFSIASALAVDSPQRWVSVIPSPRDSGMECDTTKHDRQGQSARGDHARSGGHDAHDPHRS